ncbi:unnamed protein product [Urochloa decumbens]|uniref:E3 ubiquitin-protein ligase PRT1 n=1 Tax=Urochloa decumbens TaxID=240449 RepID=A0ABC8VAE0_9POAL
MASAGHPPEPGKKEEVATTASGPGASDLDDPQFMCCVCLDLLYKPVVISCGHMSCFWCVQQAMHIFQESHCAVCRQPYKHFPSICQLMHHLLLKLEPAEYKRREKEILDLDHFLEEYFPAEYESRGQKVQSKKGQFNREGSSSGTSSAKGSSRAQHADALDIHISIGCDSCGVYPIRGERYKCKDCTELIGFDLCGTCYRSSSKLPGRFNQQHTPDHRMELDNSALLPSFLRGQELQMIEALIAPGTMVPILFGNQGMDDHDEGQGEVVVEEPVVAPGDMLHIVNNNQEIEDNGEEEHEA